MTFPTRYDVAVVGAGPAGARSAEALARRGFNVALFERDPLPGLPVHCTGIVSAECFERYGLPASLLVQEVKSFVLTSPSGRRAHVRRNATQAYVLDRVELDRLLVRRAVNAGAELIMSTAVEAVTWAEGGGATLRASQAGYPIEVSARSAIVATGFGSKLPRRVGLGGPSDVLSGCQAVVENIGGAEELEVMTGSAYGDGGFGWLLPWKPGLALTGILTRRDTMAYLRTQVARLQYSGRIGAVQEMFRCRAIPLGASNRTVMNGIIGVGDAMGQVKPTSGGGIFFSLLCADVASEVLGDALLAGDVSAARLQPYERRWRALLEQEIRQGYALRRILEQMPEPVVEHLHRMLNIPGLRNILLRSAASFDWHSGPLTNLLARLQKQTERARAPAH